MVSVRTQQISVISYIGFYWLAICWLISAGGKPLPIRWVTTESQNDIMQHWIALLLHRDQLTGLCRVRYTERQIVDLENSSFIISDWLCCWKDELKSRQASACRRQRMQELCLGMFPAASHTSCGKELLCDYWPEIFVLQTKLFKRLALIGLNSLSYTWNACLHKNIFDINFEAQCHNSGCGTTHVVPFTVKYDLSGSRGGLYMLFASLPYL